MFVIIIRLKPVLILWDRVVLIYQLFVLINIYLSINCYQEYCDASRRREFYSALVVYCTIPWYTILAAYASHPIIRAYCGFGGKDLVCVFMFLVF